MKTMKTLGLAGALFLAAGAAQAAPIVLDFEGVGDFASVNNFYNGGTDSAGNAGTDYGISFTSTAKGALDSDAGGRAVMANEPSPDTALGFTFGTAIMNVAAGFETGLSFFYSSIYNFDASVVIYDGLNGTGNILATLDLPTLGEDCEGDPDGIFCVWAAQGTAFSGTAYSVAFVDADGFFLFDNLTLGATTPGEAGSVSVPEPGTLALLGAGLAGLGLVRRRARTA